MGRFYTLPIAFTAQTVAVDLAEIVVPADAVMVLHEIKITQSTEFGDAAAEMLEFAIKRATGSYTSGSGGNSGVTLNKHQTGDAAAGITAETQNTTQAVAGSGALTTLLSVAEHVANGWHYLPTPEARIVFSPAEACVISMAAPDDSVTVGGYVVVEEIGG